MQRKPRNCQKSSDTPKNPLTRGKINKIKTNKGKNPLTKNNKKSETLTVKWLEELHEEGDKN